MVSLSDAENDASFGDMVVTVAVAPLPRRTGVERPVPVRASESVMLLFFLWAALARRALNLFVDSDSSLSLAWLSSERRYASADRADSNYANVRNCLPRSHRTTESD